MLKEKQLEALTNIYELTDNDYLIALSTGYGKSLITYFCSRVLRRHAENSEENVNIVLTPLNAIQEDPLCVHSWRRRV